MKFYKFLLIAFAGTLFFYSCSDDDVATVADDPDPDPEEMMLPFENGFLITNQGIPTTGFGSVDFVDATLTTVTSAIYQDVNGSNLGPTVQSMGFFGDLAYIITNETNRITVVNRFTFEEVARIETGLENPRYFLEANGKGYVSNWGDPSVATDDFIAIIDLTTNEVTGTIPVGEGPEELLFNRFNIYVANQGGISVNNTVTVIDPVADVVTSTIPVGEVPNSLQIDDNGSLWVLGGGSPASTGNETAGTLSVINTASNQVITTFLFGMEDHPNYLNIVGDELYYFLDGAVFKSSASNFQIPSASEISGVDFSTMMVVNNGATLLGTDIGDGMTNGEIQVYNLQDNTLTTTLNVGIVPNHVYINP
ncbi:DUF5074 domain-containing protein [uncultured Dokdonia sp.]|uniref:YncE family protein n=1 Tax=uncultured Dokdonia sp. TaxID=575653 RepID=UPI002603E7C9|nr:DUF5074 domain-containing protein [uncultured Dokdonia sp.]